MAALRKTHLSTRLAIGAIGNVKVRYSIKISSCPHYDVPDGVYKNSEKKYGITRRNTLF
jgi:hypothetical protein